jgi:hypothetical protein
MGFCFYLNRFAFARFSPQRTVHLIRAGWGEQNTYAWPDDRDHLFVGTIDLNETIALSRAGDTVDLSYSRA